MRGGEEDGGGEGGGVIYDTCVHFISSNSALFPPCLSAPIAHIYFSQSEHVPFTFPYFAHYDGENILITPSIITNPQMWERRFGLRKAEEKAA